jgi:hypothetical protein
VAFAWRRFDVVKRGLSCRAALTGIEEDWE